MCFFITYLLWGKILTWNSCIFSKTANFKWLVSMSCSHLWFQHCTWLKGLQMSRACIMLPLSFYRQDNIFLNLDTVLAHILSPTKDSHPALNVSKWSCLYWSFYRWDVRRYHSTRTRQQIKNSDRTHLSPLPLSFWSPSNHSLSDLSGL